MKVTRTASAAFTVEFESEDELREEQRANLSMGGLRLATTETVALNATLLVTLRGPWGGESFARATVVAILPDAIALAIDGNPDEHLARLLANLPTIHRMRRRRKNKTSGTAFALSPRWKNF